MNGDPQPRPANDPEALREAARLLRAGEVVVFPTETVYALGCHGLRSDALRRLRRLRRRPADKGFILLIAEAADVTALAERISPAARRLMNRCWPGPLTLVLPARPELPRELTGGQGTMAVRLSSHPVARELARLVGAPLAAPSANRPGEPPARTAAEALAPFGEAVAWALDGGTSAGSRPSTVVDVTGDSPMLLRAGALPWTEVRSAAETASEV